MTVCSVCARLASRGSQQGAVFNPVVVRSRARPIIDWSHEVLVWAE